MDVKNAFLYGNLIEYFYMEQLSMYLSDGEKTSVRLTKLSID